MYIKKIKLLNFRNYENQEIEFDKNINIIYGDNAQGKTNILESIFICSLGKSFRTNKDQELIKSGENNLKIEIEAQKEDREVNIKLNMSEKKNFFVNNIPIKKTSEIVGKIYTVLFTPEDISIFKNEPSKRRRFLNIIISQIKPKYLYNLNQYNKTIEQRNLYLKQIKFENKSEENLSIWDEQIYKYGLEIYKERKNLVEKINDKIKKIHYNTTEGKEKIEIKYYSNINEKDFLEKLKKNRYIDIQKGYTTIGIHRDDFYTYINDKDIAIYGSQGQKRAAIISLKMAEAEILYDETDERPILLLDDFMSELDKKRIKGIVENINENQVIITCTDSFKINNSNYNLYEVKDAKIENIYNIK